MKRRTFLSSVASAGGVVVLPGCAGVGRGPIDHDVGESFRARSVQFVVREATTRKRIHWIGGNFTEARGEFVLVRMTVTNRAEERIDLPLDEWITLVDGEGRTHRIDTDLTFNSVLQLDPEESRHPLLVYDVSPDQRERKLHVVETPHYVTLRGSDTGGGTS